MDRLNSFPLKVSLPTIGITILLIGIFGFLSANTARKNTTNIIFDKMLSAVYSRIEYQADGNTQLEALVGTLTGQTSCTLTAQQEFNLDKITVCDDGQMHILIPTLEGQPPHIYSGLISISVWDSDRNLLSSVPKLDAENADLLERNQRKILDWRLSSDNSDFPNGFVYRSYPDRYPLNFFNRDVIYGIPIYDADKSNLLGSIILIISPSTFSNRWFATRTFLLIMLPIFLSTSLFGAYYVARNIRHRIRTLQAVTNQWALGNFEHRIVDPSRDEIGLLAHDLNEMALQLEELIDTKAILAKVETRQRIARDLHDAAKQQLFAASMQLSAANSLIDSQPDSAREHLNNATDLTKQAQQELSAVINELRPVSLKQQTFEDAIDKLVRDFSRQQKLPVELSVDMKLPIPKNFEQPIYRIIQEALSNIAKHSQATSAEINLISHAQKLEMVIRDNGVGFDPLGDIKGFGLESMRQRTEKLDGQFKLESSENGTAIFVSF